MSKRFERKSRIVLAAWAIALAATASVIGCHRSQQSEKYPDPAPAPPAVATTPFSDSEHRVEIDLPAGWTKRPSDDYVLLLSPHDTSPEIASVSLEIPKLPPHIPGLIPIASVKNGYLDDLRKQFGSIQTTDEPAPKIANAQVQRVRSAWTKDGKGMVEDTVLLVHGDGVYILRATSDAMHEASTRDALEKMVASLRWLKP